MLLPVAHVVHDRVRATTVRSTRIAAMRSGATASGLAAQHDEVGALARRERALLVLLELQPRGVAREERAAPPRRVSACCGSKPSRVTQHCDRVQHVGRLDRRVRRAADAARPRRASARSG